MALLGPGERHLQFWGLAGSLLRDDAPRAGSFSEACIAAEEPSLLVVEDATLDPRQAAALPQAAGYLQSA